MSDEPFFPRPLLDMVAEANQMVPLPDLAAEIPWWISEGTNWRDIWRACKQASMLRDRLHREAAAAERDPPSLSWMFWCLDLHELEAIQRCASIAAAEWIRRGNDPSLSGLAGGCHER